MPAQLMAMTEGPSILLDKPILLFGRNPECDIQIESRKISRRHCCIAQVNDYLVVRDLGSTNGIRINGVRVTEGKLKAGDELTIGNHRYQVRWDPLEGRTSRPTPMAAEPDRMSGTLANPENDDDELLESCDEPVALDEPEEGTPRANGPDLPFTKTTPSGHGLPVPPPSLINNRHVDLPEQIDLAPSSESQAKQKPSKPE